MVSLRYIVFLLFLLLLFTASPAQERKTGPREARLWVDSVFTRNDSLLVVLSSGNAMGVQPGLVIKCFSQYKDRKGMAIDPAEVGYGTIIMTERNRSIGHILLNDKNHLVSDSDHVLLTIDLPGLSFESLLYDVSVDAISFTSYYQEPFFDFNEFAVSGTKEWENRIKNAMLDDIHMTYEKVRSRKNLPDTILKIMTRGRYPGKTPLDVLRDASLADLNSFLLYVKVYPGKYYGTKNRISESFMGWLISYSPYTREEVKLALMPWYKNKTEFSKRIKPYRESIIAEGHCEELANEAVALAAGHQLNESNRMLEFAMAIAGELKDTTGKAAVYLFRAQAYQETEKYKEVVAECDNAIRTARLINDPRNPAFNECKRFELAAIIKKGFFQYQMSLYKEGMATLNEAKQKLDLFKPLLSKAVYNESLQRYYEYAGMINYSSGDYTKAAELFEEAITINDIINTRDSKNRNASHYKYMGKIYNELRNYSKALSVYEKAYTIYGQLKDITSQLLVQIDIGEALYSLGDYPQSIEKLSSAGEALLGTGNYDNAGYAFSFAGSAYWQTGKYDLAITNHKKAIEYRQMANSKSGQAFSWNQLGELYQLSGYQHEALAAFDSSIVYYSKIPNKSGIADNYNSIGEVYLNDENFKMAVDNFEKARGVTSKTTVRALYLLGTAWKLLDTVKARNYLLQCNQLSMSSGNDLYKFYSFSELSKLAYRNNNFAEAGRYYDSVARMAREYNSSWAEAMRTSLKAYADIYDLEVDSAITGYQRSVAIYDTTNLTNAVWERLSLAEALISKGDFIKANTVLQKGIRIADSLSAMLPLGSSYTASSFLNALLGEFEKGMQANEKAKAIYSKTGNVFRQAGALMTQGALYKTAGEFKRSIESLLAADSIYKAAKTETLRSTVLNNIGVTYYNQGDYARAVDYFDRSAKYFKAGLIDETYLLNKSNLADCYYYLGKKKEAEKILLTVFPLAKSKNANRIASAMAITLGNVYFDEKQFGKAGQYLDTAKAMSARSSEKEKMVDAMVALARLQSATGNDPEAEKNLLEAKNVIKEYYIPSLSWIAFYESGLLYYRRGKFDKAIEDFRNAVEIVEKNSSNIYGGEAARAIYRNDPRKVDLYGKLVVALQESGQNAEAWAYANRSNITGINELMGGMVNQTGDPAKDAALEQARSLSQKKETLAKKEAELKAKPQTEQVKSQLESVVQEKEIAEAEYITYIENLLEKYKDLKENFYDNVNPVDFEKYKGLLPADMAVLLYVINDNKLLIFSLTNEKLGITPVTLTGDITRTIREYAALLRVPGKATGTGAVSVRSTIEGEEDNIDVSKLSFKDVSEKLYKLIITPVAETIRDKKKLCIIPNGDLGNIPFQALGYKGPGTSFSFLIEEKMLFYTSRMNIFDADPPVSANMSSFAVFGVPDKTLKHTEDEARSIAGIMNISNEVYTANKATEQQAKQSLIQKKYIHFATHGILNYTDYNASYLKFLPAADTSGGNNGQLTINEIYKLPIGDCDLVTLSACETAIGGQKIKGWKISPANSLMRKRVKSVIATMWKVDDEATSILMDEFYRQLNARKGKGEALRLAQEKLSRDQRYSHPYFWSAFVLYGDWR